MTSIIHKNREPNGRWCACARAHETINTLRVLIIITTAFKKNTWLLSMPANAYIVHVQVILMASDRKRAPGWKQKAKIINRYEEHWPKFYGFKKDHKNYKIEMNISMTRSRKWRRVRTTRADRTYLHPFQWWTVFRSTQTPFLFTSHALRAKQSFALRPTENKSWPIEN